MNEQDKPAGRWRVEHWPPGGAIVRTTARGLFDRVLVTQKASETLAGGRALRGQRFLIDDREAQSALDTLQIYELPRTLEQLGLSRSALVAVVYSASSPSASDFRFFETVANNQGFHVKLFTAIEPALEWLHGDGESNP